MRIVSMFIVIVVLYFRAENPEVFKDLKPSTVEHVYDAGVSQFLPKPDKFGRRVLYFRPGTIEVPYLVSMCAPVCMMSLILPFMIH